MSNKPTYRELFDENIRLKCELDEARAHIRAVEKDAIEIEREIDRKIKRAIKSREKAMKKLQALQKMAEKVRWEVDESWPDWEVMD